MNLFERNHPVNLPNRNPNGINPALMTFDEYYTMANGKDKSHPDSAYDLNLAQLNAYGSKADYPTLYRHLNIHKLPLEVRLFDRPEEWGIAVFNGDQKIAAVQDEWGTLLVMVAREYRGFGLGPILVKMARTIQPDRPSGGFSPKGYRNFIKVYQSMVRDALSSGLYHTLITQGKITMLRVKAIIASANLPKQEIKPSRNLNSDEPKTWLLYVGEYGDFVLYDRKLKELLADRDDRDEYWINRMVKGFAYVQLHDGHRDQWAMLRQFGGDTAVIKRFMINCAVQYSNVENYTLWLEPAEIDFIDKRMVDRVEGPEHSTRGFTSYKVIPTGESFDYVAIGKLERAWRKSFDRYDEFSTQMIELAHQKFRYVEPERGAETRHKKMWVDA